MTAVQIPGIKDTEFEATASVDGRSLVMRLWGNAVEVTVLRRCLAVEFGAVDHVLPTALSRRGLTRRQAEVLIAVAHGQSNRDVAAVLGLSERTIQKHLERRRSLESDSRTTRPRVCRLSRISAVVEVSSPAARASEI